MKKSFLVLMLFFFLFPIILNAQEIFVFDSIPSNVTAGDSFYIHIICTSNPTFSGAGELSIRPDPGYNPMQPTVMIIFNNGGWGGYVSIFMASDSLYINCTQFGYADTNLSPQIIVGPNSPERLRILLPGQIAQPGYLPSRGRQDMLYVETANVSFTVNISVTDYWWNPVGAGQDTIRLSSNNLFPIFPPDTMLSAGNIDLTVRLRSAMDACTIFVDEITQDTSILESDRSSRIRILPGNFTKLLLTAPGQTLLPGDTTTNISQFPGASGSPSDQTAGIPFNVSVRAVDDFWNTVSSAPNDVVRVMGYPINPVTGILTNGVATLSIVCNQGGIIIPLQATDTTNFSISPSYNVPVQIVGSRYIVVSDEDTVLSNQSFQIHIAYVDANGDTISGATHWVQLDTDGSGIISPDSTQLIGGVKNIYVRYTTGIVEDIHIIVSDDNEQTSPGSTNLIHVIPTITPEEPVVNYPNPFGSDHKHTTISYYLSRACDVNISIYDRFGNLVKTWKRSGRVGYNYLTWNGKNNRGKMVANGAYLLAIRATERTETVHVYRRWIAVVK